MLASMTFRIIMKICRASRKNDHIKVECLHSITNDIKNYEYVIANYLINEDLFCANLLVADYLHPADLNDQYYNIGSAQFNYMRDVIVELVAETTEPIAGYTSFGQLFMSQFARISARNA